jgi:Sulfotransferase family
MPLPNFLIIGAAKAGTTSVYHYLKQHPDVFMPSSKEPNLFFHLNNPAIYRDAFTTKLQYKPDETDFEQYQALFRETRVKRIGEASTLYLPFEHAAKNIHAHLPEVKLIAILRHPVDRAYSQHVHLVRDGREPIPDFGAALEAEPERIREGWFPSFYYRTTGYYAQQLTKYFELFPKESLRVYLYEDLKQPQQLVADIFKFLGVDETFTPDFSLQLNISGLPKNRGLHDFVKSRNPLKSLVTSLLPESVKLNIVDQVNRRNLTKPPPLSPTLRQVLLEDYKEDMVHLQDLLGRDLSDWLNPRVKY